MSELRSVLGLNDARDLRVAIEMSFRRKMCWRGDFA
jgi:hypothetical protein